MAINKNKIMLLRVIVVLIYLLLYPMAWLFPIQWGWENGLIENTQLAICFIGFIFAAYAIFKVKDKNLRWFWSMIIAIWFILFWRELSWGACFYPPTSIDPQTGGAYPSALLWYKPIVHPLLWLILICIALVFVIKKQYRIIAVLWHEKQFPLIEFVLAVLGVFISTAAEGHMHLSLPLVNYFTAGQMQIVEELGELAIYLALLAAQLRVWQLFKKTFSVG
ncbi:hypothetical protein RHO12_03710 [Orbus sturtevantii]|uniref:hypothetical protein n=1 Tax=Orbus sturtevantii TaxID=3074109 RepID=UPI00370DAF77